jgi:hypothetical protein
MPSTPQKSAPDTSEELNAPLTPPQSGTSWTLTRRRIMWGVLIVVVLIASLALISEGFTSFIKFLIMLFIRLFIRIISLVFKF